METHYQKENRLRDQYQGQPEASKYEISFLDKENIFKEIYSNMYLFEKLIYEAKQYDDKVNHK
jgi:hypothetical protein